MTIREVTKEDFDKLLPLEREFVVEFNREKVLSGIQLIYMSYRDLDGFIEQCTWKDINNSNRIDGMTYIYEQDNEIVGYISGKVVENQGRIYAKVGLIENWFVSKKFRGQKFGTALYLKILEFFKEKEAKFIKVAALTQNLEAREMYKHLGFEELAIELIKPIE